MFVKKLSTKLVKYIFSIVHNISGECNYEYNYEVDGQKFYKTHDKRAQQAFVLIKTKRSVCPTRNNIRNTKINKNFKQTNMTNVMT